MCCGRSLLCRGWHAAQLHRSCVQPTWVTVMFLPFLKLCTLCSWKITVSKKNEGQEEAGQETWTENCPFSQASSTPKLLWQQLPDKNLWPDPQEKKKENKKTQRNKLTTFFLNCVFFVPNLLGRKVLAFWKPRGPSLGMMWPGQDAADAATAAQSDQAPATAPAPEGPCFLLFTGGSPWGFSSKHFQPNPDALNRTSTRKIKFSHQPPSLAVPSGHR